MGTILLYNIILLCGACNAYFAEYSSTFEQRTLCRFLCFLVMFIPAALRYDIGTDYSFYVDAYNFQSSLSGYEYGFRVIVNCLKMFSFSSQSLFVFTSFLIYAPICFFLKREGFFLKLVLFLLIFYLYSYNIIRNSIALSFLLIALEQYFYGHKFRAYLIYAFACVFHYSMFFFIPFFLLDYVYFNKKILVLIFMLVFYMVFTNKIFVFFSSPLFLNSKYGIYMGSIHSNETDIGTGFGVLLYLLVPITTLTVFLIKYDVKIKMYVYMLFFYVVSYLLALKIQIFGRLSDIFSISLICLIPYMFKHLSKRIRCVKYIVYMSYLLFFLLYQAQIIMNVKNNVSGGHGINPYESIIL